MHFLLPCPCGKSLPIEPRQAGEEITCSCGQQLTIPTMREMRLLPSDGKPAVAPSRNWSGRQGWLFSGGAAIVLIAVIAFAFLTYKRSKLELYTDKPQLDYEAMEADSAEATDTPVLALDEWNKIVADGLQPRDFKFNYEIAQDMAKRNVGQSVVAAFIGAVGLLLAASAFIVPATSPASPPGKRPAAKRSSRP